MISSKKILPSCTHAAAAALILLVLSTITMTDRSHHRGGGPGGGGMAEAAAVISAGGEQEFLELQTKLQYDVLELREQVERAYENRCNPNIEHRCRESNYHSCHSSFPNAVCPASEAFRFDACGNTCGTRWDLSVSTVRFPPKTSLSFSSSSSMDPSVMEEICFSQQLEDYFTNKYETDLPYWSNWDIDSPPWMHFGGSNGACLLYTSPSPRDS